MDIYYIILVLPAFLFALYAQFKMKSTYNKYSKVKNLRGLTGAEVAIQILQSYGLNDVAVDRVEGTLTDHYDPNAKAIRLSSTVYESTSVAAIGVAAHEAGHALQHSKGYALLDLRNKLVPVAGLGSAVGPYMAIFGLIFRWSLLAELGIILFTIAVAFYLITLPVEFNASKRAINILESNGILESQELGPTKKVLSAAAMTYVASAAVAMANLLRLVLLYSGIRDND
jgi:uncharacterized protein